MVNCPFKYIHNLDNWGPKKHISQLHSYTNNIKKRIKLHNSGKGAKFTRGRKWTLIYKEKYNSKKEAISREYYIKKNRKLGGRRDVK